MIIKVFHDGETYAVEAPEGSVVSRHGQKPTVLGESLDDILRVPTRNGPVHLPTPLVVHCAKQRKYGLKLRDPSPPDC